MPVLLLVGALVASAEAPASAQSNVVAPPPPPREGTVGPEQLRDFSLGGSNTQRTEPAEQPPPQQSAPVTSPDRPAVARRTPTPVTNSPTEREGVAERAPAGSAPASGSAPATAAAPTTSLALPPPTPAPSASFDFNSPGFGTPPSGPAVPALPPPVSEENGASMWPWLLAFAVVIAGGLFLWSRRRTGSDGQLEDGALAFAGAAPAPPAPRPEPRPAAPRAAAPSAQPAPALALSHPKGVGIVSTRLRPWLDLEVQVAAAALTEEELQLHLQLVVANSGSVPARQVGVEVLPLNAGPDQDRELATFFARPDPQPQAAEMIAPLDQAVLQTVVRMPRTAFREYAAGEGRVLVPLVALNVVYRAGNSMGRTSRAYLIGRGAADSEKLGPLRTDPGPREFRGMVARSLPGGVRR
ncbi:hypothetical protein [uncultured Sphingomonas sp.]|uniref:hypothetical protein n=1 Tax=uncultured Sphingomonas sp. TaxID=158754 RepID=UPI0025F13B89|nr:hypothetical protein [uncultured Sphingomonas sp.]